MNIFVTDPAPTISAKVLPDKHIVKMPLETCQMLSIVCSDEWGHSYGKYIVTMVNHTKHPKVHFVIIPALYGQMIL